MVGEVCHASLRLLRPLASRLCAPLGAQTVDSSFTLSTRDPGRSPSPFIGNGRLGVVIPPLGIGATPTFLAGLYENAPQDIPRIVGLPAWNAIGINDGNGWLDTDSSGSRSVEKYTQTVDMRTGTARTSYDWVDGARRTSVEVQAFVSRADPGLAALRLRVTPHHARAPPHQIRDSQPTSTQADPAGNASSGRSRTGSPMTSGTPDT